MHTLWTKEQWNAKTSRVQCHGAELNQTDGFQVTTTPCVIQLKRETYPLLVHFNLGQIVHGQY